MSTDYRRIIAVDADAYWRVEMGRLDPINGPASYLFPSEYAAFRFAASHKRRDPQRAVAVHCPDGQIAHINLTAPLGDLDDSDDT